MNVPHFEQSRLLYTTVEGDSLRFASLLVPLSISHHLIAESATRNLLQTYTQPRVATLIHIPHYTYTHSFRALANTLVETHQHVCRQLTMHTFVYYIQYFHTF